LVPCAEKLGTQILRTIQALPGSGAVVFPGNDFGSPLVTQLFPFALRFQ